MKKVTIYSTPTCHFCKDAKTFFKDNNIEYTEINVATDLEERKKMIEKSGQMGVPVITIDDDILVGFNKDALKRALDIK